MATMLSTPSAREQQCNSTSFVSLPPEALQGIFGSLPDVVSLKAVLLTCSLFYRTFFAAESLNLNGLLCSQIGSDVMPIASMLSKAYDTQPWSKAAVLDYLSHLHEYRAPKLPMTWNFPDALRISQLHHDIEFFANNFAITKLALEAQPSPSRQEERRIRRTLYVSSYIVACFAHKDLYIRIVSVLQNSVACSLPTLRRGKMSNWDASMTIYTTNYP